MAHESSSHGPGSEAKGGGIRQHKRMAMGESIGEGFGVEPLPGTRAIKSPHGEPNAAMLGDHERAGPPAFKLGPNSMHASHNPMHGAHHHPHSVHHVHAPKGKRPHHVG